MGRGVLEVQEEGGFLGSAFHLEDDESGDDGEEGEESFLRKQTGHAKCWASVAAQGAIEAGNRKLHYLPHHR